MAQPEIYLLARPKREPETRTFNLDGDGQPLTLTLRRASFSTGAAAEEEAAEMVADYITGNPLRDGMVAPFPFDDITPSRTLFRVAALIRHMQAGERRLSTMELIRLSEDQPNNWTEVMRWFGALSSSLTESMENFPAGPKA